MTAGKTAIRAFRGHAMTNGHQMGDIYQPQQERIDKPALTRPVKTEILELISEQLVLDLTDIHVQFHRLKDKLLSLIFPC